MADFIEIEITIPPPTTGIVGSKYTIEGSVRVFDVVGALPWVYARIQRKSWARPDILEDLDYERGFPMPVSGDFKIDWTPKEDGIYEVTIVATPAPIALPVVGVFPITAESDMIRVEISALTDVGLEILSCSFA